MTVRLDLERIFAAGVEATEPSRVVQRHLAREGPWVRVYEGDRERACWQGPCLVVGAGKAAARMAAGCEVSLGASNVRGFVVTSDGGALRLSAVRVAEAAHPIPDERGLRAATSIGALVAGDGVDPVLCLVSGGASSLLVSPQPPITLSEKIETMRLLYGSGADIAETNTVRKHISGIKGGGLARMAGGRMLIGLILSDVIGDEPAVIGSGPTVADPTTFADAWSVLQRFELEGRVPATVRDHLRRGMKGEVPETLKPPAVTGHAPVNIVVGSNRAALRAAAEEANRLGYDSVIHDDPIRGDTTVAARLWGETIRAEAQRGTGVRRCFIAGGETTVRVTGPGRGGRNQEFALVLAEVLTNSDITVLSAGTDGIDGPTDAAGAFVDGTTLERARARGVQPGPALRANDSYTFFELLGDLFRPGPTGTNVMDIKIAVVAGS